MIKKLWSEICLPVKIYLFLQIISLFIVLCSINKGTNSEPGKVLCLIGSNLLTSLFFAWIGNLLCEKGYTNLVWFLLIILPIIITLIIEWIII